MVWAKRAFYAVLMAVFIGLITAYVAIRSRPSLAHSSAVTVAIILFALVMMCLIIALDIIYGKRAITESIRAATEDPITGLNNESFLETAIKDLQSKKKAAGFGLACLDITAFRRFNAMFGYSAGDLLLRIVANVLKTKYTYAARTHSDLFLFLTELSPDMVPDLLTELYQAIEDELGLQYVRIVSFSSGVCPLECDDKPYMQLRDDAIFALRQAKLSPNTNASAFYDANLHQEAALQKDVETNMMRALTRGEFQLFIQPLCHLSTGECGGGEALVRWSSDKLGLVMPEQFIALFEKNGFIAEIDFFMLRSVFSMMERHMSRGLALMPISINQSKVSISFPNYLDRLKSLVRQHSIPLSLISIEITESALESNFDAVLAIIREIKNMGFRVSVDDFGSGYSSLGTLCDFPADTLKIDRRFLLDLHSSESGKKIIKSIVELSKNLGMSTVCEGVETSDQFEYLREMRCDYVQGFYYARPMPLCDFEKRYLSAAPSKENAGFYTGFVRKDAE